MKCMYCGGKSVVIDTRHTDEETYRKLKCTNGECGRIFYTIEYEVDANDPKFKCIWSDLSRHRARMEKLKNTGRDI